MQQAIREDAQCVLSKYSDREKEGAREGDEATGKGKGEKQKQRNR